MARGKEVEVGEEKGESVLEGWARKSVLEVWASPGWKLKKEGQEVKLISPAGFFGYPKPSMVELKITVEEI